MIFGIFAVKQMLPVFLSMSISPCKTQPAIFKSPDLRWLFLPSTYQVCFLINVLLFCSGYIIRKMTDFNENIICLIITSSCIICRSFGVLGTGAYQLCFAEVGRQRICTIIYPILYAQRSYARSCTA